MASKKNKKATTNAANLPVLRIGSRVRCTDDGVEGRIVWVNGLMVKIEWTDGEKVTWRRDSLATKPIVILDVDDESATAPAATDSDYGSTTPTEAAQPPVPSEATATESPALAEPEATVATTEQAEPETTPTEPTATETAATATEPITTEPAVSPEATVEQATPSTDVAAAPTTTKPKRQRKAPAEPKEKKVSALDAAAKVLAEEGRPMSCKELIGAMAIKGYWTSPGGKTPDATLYSAILREIDTKGAEARFEKVGRGQFARKA